MCVDFIGCNISLFTKILWNWQWMHWRIDGIWFQRIVLPKDEVLQAEYMVLNSTYFTFDEFCRQTGSSLSSVLADLVMQDLENLMLSSIEFLMLFTIDIWMILSCVFQIPSHWSIVNKFNSVHPRLQFTLEVSGDTINFLNIFIYNYTKWRHIKIRLISKAYIFGQILKIIGLSTRFFKKKE